MTRARRRRTGCSSARTRAVAAPGGRRRLRQGAGRRRPPARCPARPRPGPRARGPDGVRAAAPRRPVPRAQLRRPCSAPRTSSTGTGTGYARPASAGRPGAAAVACERALSVPGQLAGGSWPTGTRDYLQAHADRQGERPQEAVAVLGAGLLAGLRDYADAQGTSFREALAAGLAAHARQRLLAESPFRTGQDPAPGLASQATAPFTPCATHQGVVVSAADAEWLLVRTAADCSDCPHQASQRVRRPPA